MALPGCEAGECPSWRKHVTGQLQPGRLEFSLSVVRTSPPGHALLTFRATAPSEEMTVRRRSRKRPLTDFAARSPLHAIGVWLLRGALIALLFLAAYLMILNVLVPELGDRLVEQMRTQ